MAMQAGPSSTATRRGATPSRTTIHRRAGAGGNALISQRDLPPVNREWPVSERARWLPALVMALGIIYGDERAVEPPRSGSGAPRTDD